MRIVCLQHSEPVAPANVAAWAEARGHELEAVHLYRGESLPAQDGIHLLVVLGGPMSVWEEADHPWLRDEKAWLAHAVERRVPTLGICLGSQLLAEVLGGEVRRADEREIGWWPVHRLDAAADCPVFGVLPERFDSMSWHSDTWTVPPGATLMARSEACERQAFRWGDSVYGVQFHPEFSLETTAALGRREPDALPPGRFVQQPDAMVADPTRFDGLRSVLFDLLDAIAAVHAPPLDAAATASRP